MLKGEGKDDTGAGMGPGYKILEQTESFLLLRGILISPGRIRIREGIN